MSGLQPELEYKALRSTIRERGTTRIWVILVGLSVWAALALGLVAADVAGGVTLIPLLVLAATFEISFFIHTGVERIGRYVQVFYEEAAGTAGWETVVMNYARSFPGTSDPLFTTLFAISGALNFLSAFALTTRRPGWMVVSFIAHVAFGWRLMTARRLAAGQRLIDLERFRTLKNSK
jgi:hypothetical protein